MIDSLYIAATGMSAQQTNVDVIANNLANVNTTAFKKSRVTFEDLMYRQANYGAPGSSPQGIGAAASGTDKIFTEGEAKRTGEPLNVAIRGRGFFEVTLPDGSYAYTRSGEFSVNQDRLLVNADGHPLSAMIYIPADAEEVIIGADGQVKVRSQGQKERTEVGYIEVSSFMNPNGLTPQGNNMYLPSAASGSAISETPGTNGVGELAQGYVEASNVDLVEELTSLMTAQRAYEVNAKLVQASDEILGLINALRK
jgi:flagellar basal-body rod protein FlgG